MSNPDPKGDQRAAAGSEDPAGFELPPDSDPAFGEFELRRGLLGYRKGDVDEALATAAAEIGSLRRDVSALWIAFAQHERSLKAMIGILADLTGSTLVGPGGEPIGFTPLGNPESEPDEPPRTEQASTETPAEEVPGPDLSFDPRAEAPPKDEIVQQLADLDQVLAAIQRATVTLEEGYKDEIGASPPPTSGEEPPEKRRRRRRPKRPGSAAESETSAEEPGTPDS